MRKRFRIICLLLYIAPLQCVYALPPDIPDQRILFVIDCSGSMKENWNNESKWNIAKETLLGIIDSILQKNKNVQIGVRVLGHQFPRANNNCEDTKLELPFSNKNNIQEIRLKLNSIAPQGHTPIAYALSQAASDFIKKNNTINTVILITDGFETCNGDPCAVAKELHEKNIVISPYIIGLGVNIKYHENFKCVGTFIDVKDKLEFTNTVKKIVQQTVNKTSCQIIIKNKNGNLVTDNVSYSIYDQFTGHLMYNYIYALKKDSNTDTLYLNPQAIYNIQVHSMPSLLKTNIQLIPGIHNFINFTLDQGPYATESSDKNLITVVRRNNEIIQTQLPIEEKKYLSQNTYDLEILSLPYQSRNSAEIDENTKQITHINQSGSVQFSFEVEGIGAIFDNDGNKLKEYTFQRGRNVLELLPGNYFFVYRTNSNKKSMNSIQLNFTIIAAKAYNLIVK